MQNTARNSHREIGFPWGETLFLILLFAYSFQFFTLGVNEEVMNTFIHGPNLIFHEAGHVLFMPFGQFMMILGGSLFQCALPFSLMLVFHFRENNTLWALFCLWWTGQNLTDVALYISDASTRYLPLIGGMSEDAHDWGNLLAMMNILEYDQTFGLITHYSGMILMGLTFIIGLRSIVRKYIHQEV